MFVKTGRVLTYFPKFTLDLFGICQNWRPMRDWNLFNKVIYKKKVWFHGLIGEFIHRVFKTFTREYKQYFTQNIFHFNLWLEGKKFQLLLFRLLYGSCCRCLELWLNRQRLWRDWGVLGQYICGTPKIWNGAY